ncbi:hypothetical protein A4X13_0g3015 [Tilletia indica]|uniref:Integrase catalytic domain-containing protein n=1 Tax=Tilletia indica TaxID=43049 RepID=A0A8T8T6B6_9BASI|nr:hypothetical protein A4X13_0g3015 [Tilletia indica]
MTASRGAFHTYKRLRTQHRRTVAVASGEALKIVGIGTIQLSMPSSEGEPDTLTLRNALHVPGLAVNLVSVPALQLEHIDVLFTSEGATIYTNSNELYANLDPERKASMISGTTKHAHAAQELEGASHPQVLEQRVDNGREQWSLAGVDSIDNGSGRKLNAGVDAAVNNGSGQRQHAGVDGTIGDGSRRGTPIGIDVGGSGSAQLQVADTDPGADRQGLSGTPQATGDGSERGALGGTDRSGSESGRRSIADADQAVKDRWADGPMTSGTTTETGNVATGKQKAVHFKKQVTNGLAGKILLWHRRLGHPGLEPFAKFARNGEIVGMSESQVRSLGRAGQLCNTCVETKLARIRFGKSKRRSKRRLALIHVDLVGPFIEVGGYQYFLTCVDDYSRRNWVIPLQSKGQAFFQLKTLLTRLERETGVKVQAIRSDNGGEFTSNEVKQWTREQGIAWQYTTPYSSVQNGVAERMNRTVQDKARALMHGASASHQYWPSAMTTASYLVNLLPSKAIGNKVPMERWEGQKVDTSHLRVWGCVAWIKIHDQQRTEGKLSARGLRGMFLGYAGDHKAWTILTPSHPTKKVHVSRDVRFDEGTRFVDTVLSEQNPLKPAATSFEDMLELDWEEDNTVTIETELPAPSKEASGIDMTAVPVRSDTGWKDVEAPRSSTPQPRATSPSLLDFDSVMNIEPYELLQTHIEEETLNIPGMTTLPEIRLPDPPAAAPAPSTGSPRRMGPLTEREMRAHKRHMVRQGITFPGAQALHGFHALAVSSSTESQIRLSADGQELEPATFSEAKRRKDWDKWKHAMDEQMESLMGMGTWELMELPPNRKAIGSRWVYKLKLDEEGQAARWKARLVAQGFTQQPGVDYFETFAPVARFDSARIIFALAVHHGWVIHQLDVVTAYLNGDLDEEIYMRQPPGFEQKDKDGKELVCRLRLPLYGLKQSGRQWNSKFHTKLLERGYVQCKSEPCLYVRRSGGSFSIMLIYVDDVLVVAPTEKEVAVEKLWLKATFDVTDGGMLRHFLGVKIISEHGRITLSQRAYTQAVLERFGLSHEKLASTPTDAKIPTRAAEDYVPSKQSIRAFASMIGCLKWIAQTIRPDLAFTCSVLSRFQARPTAVHMEAAKRALRFLRKTANEDLVYERCSGRVPGLVGFADADFAGDSDTSRSTTGFVFYVHGNPVSWSSRLQTSVAMSTVEAEYIALAEGLREGLWIRNLLSELGFPAQVPFELHTDNEGTRTIAQNPEAHKRTKHIALRYHAIRERVQRGEISVVRVDTKDNPADVLTKHLAGPQLSDARIKLHVVQTDQKKALQDGRAAL